MCVLFFCRSLKSSVSSDWNLPDTVSRCTWNPKKPESESPHFHEQFPKEKLKILPNILYHIGDTPLVRINRIGQAEGIKCELCKCKTSWKNKTKKQQ